MKYRTEVEYSGYSRGQITLEVEAESPEEALELFKEYDGYEVRRDVCRDDTEKDMDYISEVYEA